MQYMQQ